MQRWSHAEAVEGLSMVGESRPWDERMLTPIARMRGEMPSGHKDYSGTPLPKKLGILEGSLVHLVGAPGGFEEMLVPLPGGVEITRRASEGLDVVVLFVTREDDLRSRFAGLAARLDPAGRLWVAWPKKGADVNTDLDFAGVQGIGLDAGLVDNKSGSITSVFQGLQFVCRLKDRPR